MKRSYLVAIALFLILQVTGCATVQKKFTRKKKEPDHRPAVIYLEEGAYQKKYSNDYYYKIHFVQWKSWHADLIDDLGGNGKKVERDADEAMNHLTEMSRYLSPAKQAELKPQIDAFAAIVQKIESGHYTEPAGAGFRTELETIRRIVGNNFYYDKVKKDLLPDTVDLGASAAPSPAPAQ